MPLIEIRSMKDLKYLDGGSWTLSDVSTFESDDKNKDVIGINLLYFDSAALMGVSAPEIAILTDIDDKPEYKQIYFKIYGSFGDKSVCFYSRFRDLKEEKKQRSCCLKYYNICIEALKENCRTK
jgi:hypothetical protein